MKLRARILGHTLSRRTLAFLRDCVVHICFTWTEASRLVPELQARALQEGCVAVSSGIGKRWAGAIDLYLYRIVTVVVFFACCLGRRVQHISGKVVRAPIASVAQGRHTLPSIFLVYLTNMSRLFLHVCAQCVCVCVFVCLCVEIEEVSIWLGFVRASLLRIYL